MPPKGAGGENSTGWTEEAKLEFVVKFFYSQVQGKLDWKTAPIPAGRTMNACNHLMRGLKAKYITTDGNKDADSENNTTTKVEKPKQKTITKSNASKKRKLVKTEEQEEKVDLDDEDDDTIV